MEIKGRVVIMTGASGGIGLAAARMLAEKGARLALVARTTAKLQAEAASLGDALALTADMSQVEQARAMIEQVHKHFGRIDVLVNNAGRGMYIPIEHAQIKEYREILDLNVIGPLAAMQAVIPLMRKQGGGMIVNISSGVSKMYLPGLALYASTKYALNAISLTARAELAPDNIRVCVVHPGMTDTDFGKNALGGGPQTYRRGGARPGGGSPPPRETAEQAAAKIVEAIETEEPEVYADIIRARAQGS